MDAVRNQLRRNVFPLRCRADHARCAVQKRRHGVVKMRHMGGTRLKGGGSRVVLRFGMRNGNGHAAAHN